MKCEGCYHGFINPQPEWSELLDYYSDSYGAYERNHGNYADSDVKTVAEAKQNGEFRHLTLPIEGKKLLDVGCGGGYFLRVAKQLGAIVQGVEPSEPGAQQVAKQDVPVFHGMLEDFVKASEGRKQFDIITSNHVLEHTPDPVATLRSMKSLLSPSGFIWISVPNANCFFSRKLDKDWHSADLPFHLQQFSKHSLVLAGEKAGLVAKRSYTYSLPKATAVSLRHYLRKRFFMPQRITEKIGLLNNVIAPWWAKHFDELEDGEAVIVEFEVKRI